MAVAEPEQKIYVLKCKVKFVRKNVKDGPRQYERTLAILVPQESDERTKFFTAWLPELKSEHFELAGIISAPIDSACRFSIHRGPDEKSEAHYLFVMSKGVEDVLIEAEMEGKTVYVEILPEGSDEEADNALEAGGDYDLISGQESF